MALVGPMSSASNLIFKKTTWPCKFKLYSGLEAKFCWKHMTHIKKLKYDQPLNFRAHLHGGVFQPQTSQSFSLQGWTAQILPRNPSAEKNCNIWSRKFFYMPWTCSSCMSSYVLWPDLQLLPDSIRCTMQQLSKGQMLFSAVAVQSGATLLCSALSITQILGYFKYLSIYLRESN